MTANKKLFPAGCRKDLESMNRDKQGTGFAYG
jgi:hypothetical protein